MPFELPGRAPLRTPFERIGGREVVHRIIDDFYSRIAVDPLLRPLFPASLEAGAERQKLFFEQWLGGSPGYSLTHGQPMLRRRHFPFVIGAEHAARWLELMRAALAAADLDDALVAELMQRLEPLAAHMVNAGEDVPRAPLRPAD